MAASKKAAKQQIKFNDLDTKLRVLIVAVTFGIVGILFLSVSDAAPLSWQNRIKLFNSNRRTNTNFPSIPTPSSGGTSTGGQTIQCGSSGNNASITTGSATSNGGTANTGGNVACGR